MVFLEHNAIFADAGWRVACFCMEHPDNLPSEWSRYFIDEIEFGNSYSILEKLRRVPKVVYSFEARRKISELLDQVPADICHLHNIYHHISPSILGILREREIPTVLTLHDLKIACPEYHMLSGGKVCERCKGGNTLNLLLNRCIKHSLALSGVVLLENLVHRMLNSYRDGVSRFVVPSRFYLEKFVEWGWEEERFVHVPNFIDSHCFIPRFDAGEEFVYFGRLSGEKGVSTLIRAAAAAGVGIRIIGGGPDEDSLRELAAETGARATFTGYLRGEPLHEAIRASRAVVLPSEWYENAPLSILESYALGKPVIAASIGGIPELIREGETGAVFSSGSVEQLAHLLGLFRHYSNSTLAGMGKAARAWVEEEFSRERYHKNMLSLYRSLGVSC